MRSGTGASIAMSTPLFLASSSPRRRQILQLLGLPFTVGAASADEDAAQERYTGPVEEVAQWLAKHKAASALTLPEAEDRLVITADTTLIRRTEILGKPGFSQQRVWMAAIGMSLAWPSGWW